MIAAGPPGNPAVAGSGASVIVEAFAESAESEACRAIPNEALPFAFDKSDRMRFALPDLVRLQTARNLEKSYISNRHGRDRERRDFRELRPSMLQHTHFRLLLDDLPTR
jgi:hypothetical protein